jgi:hypothetical protein
VQERNTLRSNALSHLKELIPILWEWAWEIMATIPEFMLFKKIFEIAAITG